MDSQTVIAVCALLALMVAIADLARKEQGERCWTQKSRATLNKFPA